MRAVEYAVQQYRLNSTEKAEGEQALVWVKSFPRSGSSTGLDMFSFPAENTPRTTFAVFEPCHGLAPPGSNEILEHEGCDAELGRILTCNMTGIDTIGSWTRKDGGFLWAPTIEGIHHEPAEVQAAICKRSDVVALKTVTRHDLQEQAFPMLERYPQLKVVDMVRDPRGIFASWRTTEPFAAVVNGEREVNYDTHDQDWWVGLTGICDFFAKNVNTTHPRVHRIRYEDLVGEPMTTVKGVYSFVGLPFGKPEAAWVQRTFNANCKEQEMGQFAGCHKNSSAPVDRWRSVLTQKEQDSFANHPNCRFVAEHFGYPL
jgi:hypothetical protein